MWRGGGRRGDDPAAPCAAPRGCSCPLLLSTACTPSQFLCYLCSGSPHLLHRAPALTALGLLEARTTPPRKASRPPSGTPVSWWWGSLGQSLGSFTSTLCEATEWWGGELQGRAGSLGAP